MVFGFAPNGAKNCGWLGGYKHFVPNGTRTVHYQLFVMFDFDLMIVVNKGAGVPPPTSNGSFNE